MPIFEYKCNECNSKFEVLHRSANNDYKAECPECKSMKVKKLISSFSTSGLSESFSSSVPEENCGRCGCSSGYCELN